MSKTDELIHRLEDAGFASDFVRTCLPDWWDEQAEDSESSWLQMQLGLAQRLSLDPLSLIDERLPLRLSSAGSPKFKHLKLTEAQQLAANGFSKGLARLLLAAYKPLEFELPSTASELRATLLRAAGGDWIDLGTLLMVCSAGGIPVAHLTAFPAGIKGMAAMATSIGDRAAIFTARKPIHAAQVGFYVAHELGHIVLGHVRNGQAIVEALTLDPNETDDGVEVDDEERAADRFAFELLTGNPEFRVGGTLDRGTGRELAKVATEAGRQHRIDPGLLTLCYGKESGRWPVAVTALKLLQDSKAPPVVSQINLGLRSQLDPDLLTSQDTAYLDAVAAV